ncbi:MAG: hypothetical protein FWG67_10395 [Defluviitaleaceae bacterium]|nr:hypothetical protein [Defluviitaleaceae bacterium]
MKNLNRIVKSFVLSVVTTILILVVIALYFFSTVTEEVASFTTYFGALNVNVLIDEPPFVFSVDFSLSDQPTAIWLTVIIIFICYYLGNVLYANYKQRKAQLNHDR